MDLRRLRDRPRSFAAWTLAHGLQRALIGRGARKGDLISRMVVDPALREDPFGAYEELRERGPVSANDLISASVDHAVCNEVLRSDAFGTAGGQGELPKPLRWLHHKVIDPDALSPVDPPSMLAVDPPLHTRYRKQVARAFTARRVGRMGDRVGDVASQLLDGPDRLDPVELHQVGLLVLAAGFETTVNLIANAVELLDRHPDQLHWLQDNPDGWANAVDEVLRHQSPVQLTLRVALRETEVAGRRFAPGHGILLYVGGANRDHAVFENPASFDVTRSNADQHLAFSAGVHFCLGASLARLETAVALRALYERFPDLRVSGTPERRPTRVLRGFERLPVSTVPPP